MTCEQIKNYIDREAGFDIATKSREQHYIKYRSMYYFLCNRYAKDGHSLSVISGTCKVTISAMKNGLKAFEYFLSTNSDFKASFNSIINHVQENTSTDIISILDDLKSVSSDIVKSRLMRLTIENKKQRLQLERLRRKIRLSEAMSISKDLEPTERDHYTLIRNGVIVETFEKPGDKTDLA